MIAVSRLYVVFLPTTAHNNIKIIRRKRKRKGKGKSVGKRAWKVEKATVEEPATSSAVRGLLSSSSACFLFRVQGVLWQLTTHMIQIAT
jgi:hypothetical protein